MGSITGAAAQRSLNHHGRWLHWRRVILHHATNGRVHGLTTAASVWMTAALGVLCDLAAWKLLVVAVAGVLFLLLAGGSIEKWCQRTLRIEEKADPPDSR